MRRIDGLAFLCELMLVFLHCDCGCALIWYDKEGRGFGAPWSLSSLCRAFVCVGFRFLSCPRARKLGVVSFFSFTNCWCYCSGSHDFRVKKQKPCEFRVSVSELRI